MLGLVLGSSLAPCGAVWPKGMQWEPSPVFLSFGGKVQNYNMGILPLSPCWQIDVEQKEVPALLPNFGFSPGAGRVAPSTLF